MADLTTKPCYVAKVEGCFAHGDTLRGAMAAAREKAYEMMPEEKRIEAFVNAHKRGEKYSNRDLFDWHNRLTGSCLAGRKAFVANHGIDLDGESTVEEFIDMTENDYGGNVIRKLKELWSMLYQDN